MIFQAICRPRSLCSQLLRAMLVLIFLIGLIRLLAGESYYSLGARATRGIMDGPKLIAAVDYFTRAAEAYPYSFTFRAAQSSLLFGLSGQFPMLAETAAESLRRAWAVDPGSIEIASKLLLTQRFLNKCFEAKMIELQMKALAPRSAKVQNLIDQSSPCKGADR